MAPETKAADSPIKTLMQLLANNKKAIESVLPKHMNANKLLRLTVMSCYDTPLLLRCDPATVVASVMEAAQLGLEIGGVMGEAYLVPYMNTKKNHHECQLIPGYRGLVTLARRGKQVSAVSARVVYEEDHYEVHYGTDERIIHRPRWDAIRTDKEIIAFYVVITMPDGAKQFEVMNRGEVEAIRLRSKAKDAGPWKTDYAEMGRKTVTKRGLKYVPMSPELATAVELDNRFETGKITGVTALEVQEGEFTADEAAPESGEPSATDTLRQKAEAKREELRQKEQGDGGQG